MENIVLIGFMGSGKTSVGQVLSEKLQREFIDMDKEISAQQGKSITAIFSESGEAFFRELETTFLKESQERKNCVFSTGGGIITKEENIELLRKLGKVVFLNTPYEQILTHVKGDTQRPLLQQDNAEQVISNLLQQREPAYFDAANIIIQTKEKSVRAIADEIIHLL